MINDSFQEWKEQDSLLPLLLCMLLSPCPRASCPVQEHCFHTTATLSCFPCALIVHKPLVPLQLSLIGINLTISFWGLFPLPDTGPAWFSLAVTSLESDFRLIFLFSPQTSICTAMGLLILQMGKFFLWIWSGDICLCLIIPKWITFCCG